MLRGLRSCVPMFRSNAQRAEEPLRAMSLRAARRPLLGAGRSDFRHTSQAWNRTPSIISPRLLLMTSAYHG